MSSMSSMSSIQICIPRRIHHQHTTHQDLDDQDVTESNSLISNLQYLISTCIHPGHQAKTISLNSDPKDRLSQIEELPVLTHLLGSSSSSLEPQLSSTSDHLYDLGKGALEHCIPPPYRTSKKLINKLKASDPELKKPLKLKPWTTYHPIPHPIISESYDLINPISPLSQRRGFWLIPVWKPSLDPTDLYTLYRHQISLPYWTDSRIPSHPSITTKTIVWDPNRLKTFWKAVSKVCESQRLGDVVTIAIISSQLSSLLPTPDEENLEFSHDGLGDHFRIWCDVQTALLVRRFLSDINVQAAIHAFGTEEIHPDPHSTQVQTNQTSHKSNGKWLKDCVFMWFDETGLPRGYA